MSCSNSKKNKLIMMLIIVKIVNKIVININIEKCNGYQISFTQNNNNTLPNFSNNNL